MNTTEFQHTAKNAGLIGATAMGGALIGFFLQLLVAYYFGAAGKTDAFFMAQSTSELLSKILMGGSITAIFIPLFVDRLTRGNKEEAWNLAMNIVNIMAAAYILLIGAIFFFAGPFVHFIAPGFSGDRYTLTVSLLRVLLPSFFFLFLVEFATSILQSSKQFFVPALLRIVAPSISIISILLFVQSLGIYALAIGVVLGSIVQLSLVTYGLMRQGMRYRFFLRLQDPLVRSLLYLVYPFLLSVFMTQGAGIVYRMLASTLAEGSLSALKFAEKITQLITIIFLNSVTAVIYPLLSEKASLFDTAGIRSTIGRSMRLIVFTTLPIILTVAVLREYIVSFIYQHGSFSAEDARLTSVALLYLVLGLTTTGISSILGHAILALKETRAAVAITISSQAVAITLFILLVPHMGVAGLAFASSLVPLSSALLYYLYLTRFISGLHHIFIHRTYWKTILISSVSVVIVWLTMSTLPPVAAIQIVTPSLLGIGVYGILAYIWKIEEMHEVTNMVRSKIRRMKNI